ncbi:MAG: Fic family protein [Synergistaceae bacterium]|nr:Fic family protein [Synergistaceae bacterium]
MMIKLPVDESELAENYDVLMPEIDRLSLDRRAKIWEAWPDFVKIAGTWECLRDFHVMLFGGLFSFAGKIRTQNISKGGFRFANALFLDKILPVISEMPQRNFDEILAKYIEMNIAHPFREGNGRVLRLWLDAVLERELNTRIYWAKIGREVYMSAMQRSPVNALELEVILRKNMLPAEDLASKDIFMSGLSASYKYEM